MTRSDPSVGDGSGARPGHDAWGAVPPVRLSAVNRNYTIHGEPTSEALRKLSEEAGRILEEQGFRRTGGDEADFVLYLIDHDEPRPFRRRSRGTFAAALHERPETPGLPAEYPLLVRALANIVLCFVPGEGVWFTTM